MPIVRLGTTRAVLVIGSLALKFARHERGARCNLFEANLYKRTTPKRREMLCPVVWCSDNGAVLIAKAAIPLTQTEVTHLLDVGGLPNWDHCGTDDDDSPFEWKGEDWGRLDGRLVALDYATPEPCVAHAWAPLSVGTKAPRSAC